MLGYLDINKDSLSQGEQGMWQSFMCGLCFATKNTIGNVARAYITNDVNFFNVLFSSITNTPVQLQQRHCPVHLVKKQTVQLPTEISNKLAIANVLLVYWNLYDDVVDGHSAKKKVALSLIKGNYKKAKKLWPQMDEMIANNYNKLRLLEQSNCTSLDIVADSFANLSQEFAKLVLGEQCNDFCKVLCYNLGKWVYLIDALDDLEQDVRKNQYNAFAKCFGVSSYSQLNEQYDQVQFVLYAVLNRIAQSFNDLNLNNYSCLTTNVLYNSIRNKTQQILNKIKTITE